MSYPIITPSAARGILEAILWKPAIRWVIEEIRVLSPIAFTSFRRNEVNSRARDVSAALIKSGGTFDDYFADEDRAQRNTVALRNVDYVIRSYFELTERAGPEDNINKFVDIFRRRVEKGQYFHHPYFGCREFAADILPLDPSTPSPIDDTRDLGLMLWDIEYTKGRNRPIFFAAKLDHGIVRVPPSIDIALATLNISTGEGPA
jgi:CRISPR-associated protein Cas5d